MMAQSALKEAPVTYGEMRRFQVPDIDRHGAWMLKRFTTSYPHLGERMIPGWLRGIVYNNEFLFLYQDHSVALAQAACIDPFNSQLTVWERFVWVEDPTNPDHVSEAARFYGEFKKWALQKDAKTIVVEEQSDVPHEIIRQALGSTLLERKQIYARV
jgi:hypothetical protein